MDKKFLHIIKKMSNNPELFSDQDIATECAKAADAYAILFGGFVLDRWDGKLSGEELLEIFKKKNEL
jgi:hypothetical protein